MVVQDSKNLPSLTENDLSETLVAWQAYAHLLGKIRVSLTPPQKHWWHAALIPVLNGFSTGQLEHAGHSVELQLDLLHSVLQVQVRGSHAQRIEVKGQSSATLFDELSALLTLKNIKLDIDSEFVSEKKYPTFSAQHSQKIANVFNFVAKNFNQIRSEQRQETGPVLLWPHHFDLAFLWFSGRLIPETDPNDAEHADEQMNFGFVFGDETIREPYFYISAYPWPDGFEREHLPDGAYWEQDAFKAAILPWQSVVNSPNPQEALSGFCRSVLEYGKNHMLTSDGEKND